MADGTRVLYVVVCAAPPALQIGEFVELGQRAGWTVCVIPTPQAASWLDLDRLSSQTGRRVRAEHRRPENPETLPPATAVAVVPATFNTINKWVAGISDTLALGILNETLGLGLPIVVAPYAKRPLAAHPAFTHNIQVLHDLGVTVLPTEGIRPSADGQPFRWHQVIDALDTVPLPTRPGAADNVLPRPRLSADPRRSRPQRPARSD